MSLKFKLLLAVSGIILFNLIIYLLTLSPSIQFIDSGELAVVCKTLGIAHPTGYPLYTLWGRLCALLPFKDIIFRANLVSLFSVSLTNLVLLFIILKLLKTKSDLTIWTALLTSLIFSFTPTLWSQANSNEVYGLNVFFYSLIILLILIWREKLPEANGSNPKGVSHVFFLLIFVYGLSFGNHMMAVLFLPAISFLFLSYEKKTLFRPQRILLTILFFILGLSIYLYLPIRSSQNPLLDWGNPESWSGFKRHVSGWQYQVWMFSASIDQMFSNLAKFVKLFFKNFPIYLLPFTLLGIWKLILTDRRFLVFLLIIFFFTVAYAVNYSIPDLDPYFLGCFLVNAIFIGNGFFFVFENLHRIKLHKIISSFLIFLFILFPMINLKRNHFEQDRSRNYFAYDLVSNILRSMKKDGLIISNLWGHYSPWLYLRYVEQKRPDLVFLAKDLCFYSWYADYVKRNYPEIYKNSEDQIKSFSEEIRKYEDGEPYDLNVIRERYLNMLNGFFLRNLSTRPIYDDLVAEQEVGKMLVKIPEGLVYSLRDSFAYYPYDSPNYELRGVTYKTSYIDERTRLFLLLYNLMPKYRIKYLQYFGLEEEAQRMAEKYKDILSK